MKGSLAFMVALMAMLVWVILSSGIAVTIPAVDGPWWLIAPCMAIIIAYTIWLGIVGTLSHRQIDTVYYLGFLTTLTVLGTSVIRLTQEGATSDPGVVKIAASHFALGLLATGVGLVGRLVLQQRTASVQGITDALNQYVDSMARLSDRMDEAVGKFERLTENTVRNAEETSRQLAAKSLKVLSEELQTVVTEIRGSVTQLSRGLQRLDGDKIRSLSESVQGLDKSMSGLDKMLQATEESVRRYRTEVDASTKAHGQLATAGEAAGTSLKTLGADLKILVASLQTVNVALRNYDAEMRDVSMQQQAYAKSTEQLIAVLQVNTTSVAQQAGDMVRKMAEFTQVLGGVDHKSLHELSDALQAAVGHLSVLGAEVGKFAQTMHGANTAASGVQFQDIAKDFQQQSFLMKAAATDLGQAMALLSRELGTAIHDSLKH